MLEINGVDNNNLDIFLNFLKEIAEWLNETGRGMWSIERLEKEKFLESNNLSDCYLGYFDGKPATSIILTEENAFMWRELDQNDTVFIGKLGVAREYSGRGFAKEMLDFAHNEAKRRGKNYLRLDCYADRPYLCNLYEGYGFTLVKKSEMMPGLFAALYEMKI